MRCFVTCFFDNKLSIYFREEKTNSILFTSKRRAKNILQLNIKYRDINIKQHSEVTYFGCVLDEKMSGKPIPLKAINKTNDKLKFLYRKKRFLSPELCRMLCNCLFSHILITHVQLGTLILLKKRKRKYKLCKINA